MGLHLCFELSLPAVVPESDVAALVARLREHARGLPFLAVTDVIRLTEQELVEFPRLQGMGFVQLEDVAHLAAFFTREELHARAQGVEVYTCIGNAVYHSVDVPRDLASVAYGFAIGVGDGSEPAALGLVQIVPSSGEASSWGWHCCCKTQYASVHGDENLLRCHRALVAVLEAAQSLGFEVDVRDETGYWESRDPDQLVKAVTSMNQLLARFAGTLTDHMREAATDSRKLEAEIFKHPDFERLEMGPNDRTS